MPENRNLSYAQLTEAHAWLKGQKDENHVRLEEEGADLTEVMIRLGNGAYRAPLPRLIDRGPLTPEEIAIMAEEDGDEADEATDASDDVDDEYAALADRMYDPYDDEYAARWRACIAQIGFNQEVRRAVRNAPKPVFLADKPISDADADEIHDEVDQELARDDGTDNGPTAISSHRAVLQTGVYGIENGADGTTSWKDSTKAPVQYLRHVRRPAAYRAA